MRDRKQAHAQPNSYLHCADPTSPCTGDATCWQADKGLGHTPACNRNEIHSKHRLSCLLSETLSKATQSGQQHPAPGAVKPRTGPVQSVLTFRLAPTRMDEGAHAGRRARARQPVVLHVVDVLQDEHRHNGLGAYLGFG